MASVRGKARVQEEEIYESTPEPPRTTAGHGHSSSAQSSRAAAAAHSAMSKGEGIDTTAQHMRDAIKAFSRKEREAEARSARADTHAVRRHQDEEVPASPGIRAYEPPEQRLARIQMEVGELFRLVDAPTKGPASEFLGEEPDIVKQDLKALEQRLAALVKNRPKEWRTLHGADGASGGTGGSTMSETLLEQLKLLASGGIASKPPKDGRLTYEFRYSPCLAAITDSAQIAQLENCCVEIEKQLGTIDSTATYTDLQSVVSQLHRRLSLLDSQKLDTLKVGVAKAMGEIDGALKARAEAKEAAKDKEVKIDPKAPADGIVADPEADKKVSALYETCQKSTATAAKLPMIVTRLRSLEAFHQESAAFSSRLHALEHQQDELTRLMQATNTAVNELGRGLKENMSIMTENMATLSEKLAKAGIK